MPPKDNVIEFKKPEPFVDDAITHTIFGYHWWVSFQCLCLLALMGPETVAL